VGCKGVLVVSVVSVESSFYLNYVGCKGTEEIGISIL